MNVLRKGRGRFWAGIIIIGAVVVVGVFLAVGGYSSFQKWRLNRLDREGERALERADLVAASLVARRALQLDERHVPALDVMARICEQIENPDAVRWREKIALAQPQSLEAAIAHSAAAIRFGRIDAAQDALAGYEPRKPESAELCAAFGRVAFAKNDLQAAANHFAEAVSIGGDRSEYRLLLGDSQARSPDLFVRENGRELLRGLRTDPEAGLDSRRALVRSYVATGQYLEALEEGRAILADRAHRFRDELQQLDILRRADDREFSSALARVQQLAAAVEEDAALLVGWMSSNGFSAAAAEWAGREPTGIAQMPLVQPGLAECYLHESRWNDLLTLTTNSGWGKRDYVRRAYRARALRETGDQTSASTEWKSAISAAAGQTDGLKWLAKFATSSGWHDEALEALWATIETAADTTWAAAQLTGHYLRKADSEGMFRLSERLMKTRPDAADAKNDFAFLCLVLGREGERAQRLAMEAYKTDPLNPAYASTYALALYFQARFSEAVAVFEKLPAAKLEEPQIAAYYGLVLSAAGAPDKARRFLELGSKAPLLPEERVLIAGAMDAAGVPRNSAL